MVTDTDWDLLNKRLEGIERSFDFLRSIFPDMDAKLEQKVDYVLCEGSLIDAGVPQRWINIDL